MSVSPIEVPGHRAVAVLSLDKAPLPSVYAMTRDNAGAVQVLIDRTGLPAPTLVPGPDVVHVMLADVDDMAPWLAKLDGRVRLGGTSAALVEWTLYTELPATRRRGVVRIEVHALAVDGQAILPSLREAVA